MNHLFFIGSKENGSIAELGGKGFNLVKLTHGGFQVPGGFIVKSSGFDEFAQQNSLFEMIDSTEGDINAKREVICDVFAKVSMQDTLKKGIEEMLKSINDLPDIKQPLLAVRSSGVTEDLEEASFAGMNDTILNVPAEVNAVCEAVMKCWLSLYGKRSIVYRQEKGFPPYRTSIAVVIQIMIPSESSGVVFTADPQSGSRGQISLDGVQGLGEALVSGSVNSDNWIIRKPYLKRELFIERESIGQQEYKLCSNYPQPGTTKVELSKEEGEEQAFTVQQIHEICKVACAIEEYYKNPMDIEFCYYKDKLYIVQARPITSLPRVPDHMNPLLNKDSHQWSCWISFNSIQMLSDPLSVSCYSVLQSMLDVSDRYFVQINGYIYMNFAPIMYLKPVRNKIIPVISSVAEKEIGNGLREFYENDYSFYKHTMSSKPLRSLFNTLGKHVVKNIIKNTFTCVSAQEMSQRIKDYLEVIYDYARQKIDDSPDGFFEYARGYLQHYIRFASIVVPTFVASILARNKITKIAKKYDLGDFDINETWSHHSENVAMRLNILVCRMSEQLNKLFAKDNNTNELIRRIVNESNHEELKTLMESWKNHSDSDYAEFAKQWYAFMEEFGCRGPLEIDLASPRYSDHPCLLMSMLLNIELSSYMDEQANAEVRERATKQFLDLLSKRDRKKVEKNLPYAQFFSVYREHPKYSIIRGFMNIRNYLLHFGEELVSAKCIEDVNDVFFLKMDEIRDYKLNHDQAAITRVIQERKQTNQGMTQWPRTIMGPEGIMKIISDTTRAELENLPPNMLKGMPTSPGIIEGVAVVCTDPETAVVKKGEILVARATDPGWTPLFVPAAGVAIEIGGALSHGSVVAREMRIPCVVNIPGLMNRLKTGMRIRVDGSQGTVEILE